MSHTPLFTLRHAPNGLRIRDDRAHFRLTVGRAALSHDFAGALAVMLAGGRVHVAAVRDVSSAGLGLATNQGFKVGTEMVVKLFTARREFLCTRTLRVAHATSREDACFNVGGTFDQPLTHEQLQALVEGAPARSELNNDRTGTALQAAG
jgi:hypothetical protein